MHFEDLNWMDVENYLKFDDRLMLVVGACEQHGYLSLLTDVKIPMALASAASEQSGVPVAPPINFGASPYFARYPGTISLRMQTFLALVEDVVRWTHMQGFRRLLFLNGHGGNEPAKMLLRELLNDLPGLRADWYSWWTAPPVQAVAEAAGLEVNHGNWAEAFQFCRVADLPEGVKEPVSISRLLTADETRTFYGDGVFGGHYSVPDAVMQRVFSAALADVIERLKFE